MDEFLRTIAGPLAHLLEATANYLERATPEDFDDGEPEEAQPDTDHPMWHLNSRGEVVLR